MTKEERKIRMQVALEIINSVYTDICHDSETSREEAREFCYFLLDARKFTENFDKKEKEK